MRFIARAAAAVALSCLCTVAIGQAFPAKPVRIIVAIAGSDYVARLVAQKLTESLRSEEHTSELQSH